MRSLFRNLLLALCFPIACIPAFSTQLHNPYDNEVGKLQSRLQTEDTLHQLVLLDQIFRLWDYVDDRAAIARIFAQMQAANSIAASEARAYLRDIQQMQDGQSEPATHWYEQEEQRKWVLAQIPQSPASAGDLLIRAELGHLADVPEAADLMQQSAQRAPTAAR